MNRQLSPMPRAGLIDEIHRYSGTWAFVDLGFARTGRTSDLLIQDREAVLLTFAQRRDAVTALALQPGDPLNLTLVAR
jgi:hypothetical protein